MPADPAFGAGAAAVATERGTTEPAASTGERLARGLAACTWGLVGAWALSSLWYPFGWDQGIIAWVGATILDGGMPYRDAFDLKGPAAYYVFALAQWVFGHNLWGIRVLDLVGLAASGWLIAAVVRRYTDRRTASWAAALFALWFAGLTFWHTAQPDGFAAMLLCLGVLPLLLEDRGDDGGALRAGLARAAWSGVAIGVTVAIKPHYAAFLAVPALYYATALRRTPTRAIGRIAAAGLGSVATIVAVAAWFAYRGALDELVEVHLLYNAQAYSSGATLAVGQRLRGLFEYVLTGEVFVVLLPAVLLGVVRLARRDRVATATLGAWAALALAGVVLQNKFFDYQWIPIFPPLVIFGVIGLRSALASVAPTPGVPDARGSISVGLGHALFLVVLVHASIQPAFEVANWASYVVGLRDKEAYYDTFGVPGADLRMVEHIEANSEPEDRLIVLGWNLEILYMTDLPTVSRLAFSLPVWMGEGTALREEYREELMRDLRATPPELIVVAEQAEPLIGRPVSLDDFRAFSDYLAERYRPEVEFGPLALYRLNP